MILNPNDLTQIRSKHSDQTVVLMGGVFDLLHVGHIEQLNWAKSLGDVLVVAIPDDASVQAVKGDGRPVHTASNRAALLDSLRPVSYVVIGGKYEGLLPEVAQELTPNVVALYYDVPEHILKALTNNLPTARIVINNDKKVTSSTEIIQKIKGSTP